MNLKINDRVRFTDKPFLSDGFIYKVLGNSSDPIYVIKLDERAPNEYAWETDELISFGDDIEVIK